MPGKSLHFLFTLKLSKYSFSLSVSTALNFKNTMEIKDVNGRPHDFTQYQVQMIMLIGWVAFFASWISNIFYYKVHPSAVDFNTGRFRSKFFVYFLGRKVKLPGYRGEFEEIAEAEEGEDQNDVMED